MDEENIVLRGAAVKSSLIDSTLHLINDSFVGDEDITTCDNGINALELTIIKLN